MMAEDPTDRKGFRVFEKRCDQCLFSSAKIVSDDRREDVLATCQREDKHFVCHKATVAGVGDVCCRAFYDHDPMMTNTMRIAHRLGVVRFVDFPKED